MSVKLHKKDGSVVEYQPLACLSAQLSDTNLVELFPEGTGATEDDFLDSFSVILNLDLFCAMNIRVRGQDNLVKKRLEKRVKSLEKKGKIRTVAKEIVKAQIKLDSELDDMIYTMRKGRDA